MSKNSPYWNFWKVVFAGWLIRYPRQVFKISLILFLVVSGLIVSPFVNYSDTQTPETTERVAK